MSHCPERNLFLAVVAQAFQDAAGVGIEADHAFAWLTSPSQDLFLVCDLAGLNPWAVVRLGRSAASTPARRMRLPERIKNAH